MNITSINEIADEIRSENRRTEFEIANLRGLFAILSTRWHGEINKILSENKLALGYAGHIETTLGQDYKILQRLMDKYPDTSPEKIKYYFCGICPGYLPKYVDRFYDLAMYEKSKNA